jgi:hypothetical protein
MNNFDCTPGHRQRRTSWLALLIFALASACGGTETTGGRSGASGGTSGASGASSSAGGENGGGATGASGGSGGGLGSSGGAASGGTQGGGGSSAGGTSASGGATGAGGASAGGGTASGGALGSLCGGVACGSDQDCCGPPDCGHCIPKGTDPACPATCTSCDQMHCGAGTVCICGGPGSVSRCMCAPACQTDAECTAKDPTLMCCPRGNGCTDSCTCTCR